MQLKSASMSWLWPSSTSPPMAPGGVPALRDWARACTSRLALPMLKSMTAEDPPAVGEIAPLKA